MPTGHLVDVRGNVLFAVPFDVGRREVIGAPVPLVEGLRVAVDFGRSVSDDGSLVYRPDSEPSERLSTLTWVGRDAAEERIPAPPRAYGRPRVSPDGTRVAVDIETMLISGSGIWRESR